MCEKKALLLVDLQNDFMPGGTLAVPNAHEIIVIANQLQFYFDCVAVTQDWHPSDHCSFASNHPGHAVGDRIACDGVTQILWPIHCQQNSWGAQFVSDLILKPGTYIAQKGIDPKIDSYSGFFDAARRRATGLTDYFQQHGSIELYIAGVATDYCVQYTALDACQLGFKTYLIIDACRGIRVFDSMKAVTQMQEAGVILVHSNKIKARRIGR